MMMPCFGMGSVGLIIGFLLLLATVLGIAYGVRALGRYSAGREDLSQSSSYSALEILDRRYARNEIDKEEYESMKKDLQS